jgi:hypothetical protein
MTTNCEVPANIEITECSEDPEPLDSEMNLAAPHLFDGQLWCFDFLETTSDVPMNDSFALPRSDNMASILYGGQEPQAPSLALPSQESPRLTSTMSRRDATSDCGQMAGTITQGSDVIEFSEFKELMKRLSSKHTSSYIGEVASLLKRHSCASSWRSSLAPSMNKFRWRSSVSQGTPDPYETLASGLRDHRHNCLSNDLILGACCTSSHMCIHRQIASIANLCSDDADSVDLAGVDIFQTDPFDNGALHVAAKWGTQFAVFHSLIEADVDINAVNAARQTFMHVLDATNLLTRPGRFEHLIRRLHKLNFDLEARDHYGRTFLHSLIQQPLLRCNLDLMRWFLQLILNDQNGWVLFHARDVNGVSVASTLCTMDPLLNRYANIVRNSCFGISVQKHAELMSHESPASLRDIYASNLCSGKADF